MRFERDVLQTRARRIEWGVGGGRRVVGCVIAVVGYRCDRWWCKKFERTRTGSPVK